MRGSVARVRIGRIDQLVPLLKEYVTRVQESPPGPLPAAHWETRLNATESALWQWPTPR